MTEGAAIVSNHNLFILNYFISLQFGTKVLKHVKYQSNYLFFRKINFMFYSSKQHQ